MACRKCLNRNLWKSCWFRRSKGGCVLRAHYAEMEIGLKFALSKRGFGSNLQNFESFWSCSCQEARLRSRNQKVHQPFLPHHYNSLNVPFCASIIIKYLAMLGFIALFIIAAWFWSTILSNRTIICFFLLFYINLVLTFLFIVYFDFNILKFYFFILFYLCIILKLI